MWYRGRFSVSAMFQINILTIIYFIVIILRLVKAKYPCARRYRAKSPEGGAEDGIKKLRNRYGIFTF